MVSPRSNVGCSTNPLYRCFLDSFFGNGYMEWIPLTQTRNVRSVTKLSPVPGVSQCLVNTRKLRNSRGSEGLRSFKPSNGNNLNTLLILAGDIEMNPGPRFQGRLCKKYRKASDKVAFAKNIARHRIRSSNAKIVINAFTHHVSNLETMNC